MAPEVVEATARQTHEPLTTMGFTHPDQALNYSRLQGCYWFEPLTIKYSQSACVCTL